MNSDPNVPPQGRHPLTGALTDDYDREGNPIRKVVTATDMETLRTCILTGAEGENEDDCSTHDHEPDEDFDEETKIAKVTIDLRDGWQVWRARVPANFTEAQVRELYESGAFDGELFDSGCSEETITEIAMEY